MKLFKKIKHYYIKYEAHISGIFLIFGFIMDNLTLTRIDLYLDNLILILYLFIATLGIIFINLVEGGVIKNSFISGAKHWLPLPIQFAFGGLFSGFFVFYSRSASLLSSWPFLLFILALLIGNEFFRKRYIKLTFQLSILFIAIFSYLIFFVPIVLHKIGPKIFILSGVLSLIIITLIIYLLKLIIPKQIFRSIKYLKVSILSIFVILNFLYFTNIIPPIPLSLKEAGVYHFVGRENSHYIIQKERESWYKKIIPGSEIHITKGDRLYFFSAVFAPTDLNTNIVHEWQKYNTNKRKWETISSIKFPIIGGRDGGYRGYSFKNNVDEGLWRVRVKTENGQILGSKEFNVKIVDTEPKLEIIKN